MNPKMNPKTKMLNLVQMIKSHHQCIYQTLGPRNSKKQTQTQTPKTIHNLITRFRNLKEATLII